MLVPAVLYKEEISKKFLSYRYSDDMFYYTGYFGDQPPNFGESNDGGNYQYAIVDKDRLVGYLSYTIDWYTSCAYCFGLFSFERNNRRIGLDVLREIRKIINDYHIHRIEWRMIGGNPVEEHYDNFCKRYDGRKLIMRDAIKDKCGKYRDSIIYEIIFEGGQHE